MQPGMYAGTNQSLQRQGEASPPVMSAPPQEVAAAPQTVHDPTLPPGWEAKQDQFGKIYYVDHNSQRSQWEHPNNVAIQTTTTAVSNVKQETCGHTPQTCGYILLAVESFYITIMIILGAVAGGSGWISMAIIQAAWVIIVVAAIHGENACCIGCVGTMNIIVAVAWGFYAFILFLIVAIIDSAADSEDVCNSCITILYLIVAGMAILSIFKCVTAGYWFRIASTINGQTVVHSTVTTTTYSGPPAVGHA